MGKFYNNSVVFTQEYSRTRTRTTWYGLLYHARDTTSSQVGKGFCPWRRTEKKNTNMPRIRRIKVLCTLCAYLLVINSYWRGHQSFYECVGKYIMWPLIHGGKIVRVIPDKWHHAQWRLREISSSYLTTYGIRHIRITDLESYLVRIWSCY
jgi:trehalose-6-phosphate synthase